MKRSFTPTSPALRTVFAAMALVVTIVIGSFIDALAGSDPALSASVQAAGGPAEPTVSPWPRAL
jgi:hypothetical protein